MLMISTNQLLKPILLVFILLIPVASAKAEFIKEDDLKLSTKTVVFYSLVSLLAIFIDIAQRKSLV